MTWNDISLLLAMLGGSCLFAAWFGRRNDDLRDTLLMTVLGAGKVALAAGLWLATGP
jgi:hypothetical protein